MPGLNLNDNDQKKDGVAAVGIPLLGAPAQAVWLVDINGNPIASGNSAGLPTSTGQKTAAGSTSVIPGSTTPTKPSAVSVGATATKIRAASGTPVRVTITNDSQSILYIGLANTVTATDAATKGLAIAANGGAIVVPWQVDIWGIYATGSSYVAFMEEN